MRNSSLNTTISILALLLAVGPAIAQTAPAPEAVAETPEQKAEREAREISEKWQKAGVFELGQINVIGGGTNPGDGFGQTSGQAISQSTFSAADAYNYNTNTLDEALTRMPGVHVTTGGSSRNEKAFYIRGFDQFQSTMSIDGIRVYLPYDNRTDVSRFLTPDLAEVQVQKGYVSVLNGPGGMGGAVNLVTRKPTEAVEGEIRTGFEFGNEGDFAGYTGYGSLGTKQEKYYLQASGIIRDSDGWYLSDDFEPVNPAAEDGGLRDFSDSNDWRLSAKAGFTPNETDEYTIGYINQAGEKNAPFHTINKVRVTNSGPGAVVGDPTTPTQRNWQWPFWDYESAYFLSHTEIGEASYVDAKAFYNKFNNLLSSYDTRSFTTQTRSGGPFAFDSYYEETGYGGNVEFGTELIPMNTLKAALHYRGDEHVSRNINQPDNPGAEFDPTVEYVEDTWAVAVENTFHATERLDLVAGASWNYRDLRQADEFDADIDPDDTFSRELTNDDAINWQAAAIYHFTETGEVHASVSDRTRFPTLWERYSSRFGTAVPNEDLSAERALNFEIGGSEIFGDLKLGGAIFYSKVEDVITSVFSHIEDYGSADPDDWDYVWQNRNVGDANHYGVEFTAEWQAFDNLIIGGNYTYLKRDLEAPAFEDMKPTDTPEHTAFLYAKWEALEGFTVIPSVEIASSRYSSEVVVNDDVATETYFEHDGYALVNLTLEYAVNENVAVQGGVKNIFDELYAHKVGFPEPGRSFFVTGRITF